MPPFSTRSDSPPLALGMKAIIGGRYVQAEVLSRDWERAVAASQKRKKELGQLASDARQFHTLHSTLSIWLQDGSSRTLHGPKVSCLYLNPRICTSTQQLWSALSSPLRDLKVAECTEEELSVQLGAVGLLLEQLEEQKAHMSAINKLGAEMTDRYTQDEASVLAQTLSDLNTHWAKFNDNIRIRFPLPISSPHGPFLMLLMDDRRAVVEAALRSRQDLSSALGELESWLRRIEIGMNTLDMESDNPASLRDSAKRQAWIQRNKVGTRISCGSWVRVALGGCSGGMGGLAEARVHRRGRE